MCLTYARMTNMKRITITIPDVLAEAAGKYIQSQEAPPALTAIMQMALRQYLGEQGYLRVHRYLDIAPSLQGSGSSDGSQAHDRYLTGTGKRRHL